MIKKTFKYCGTHKGDENYMQEMCAKGWAAVRQEEGFWTFEKCEPNAYCYRICYLRGKSRQEIETLKKKYAAEGIEFVSRYSFWAIFRSTRDFQLYSAEEEREICRKMYAPMPAGAAISWLIFGGSIFPACRISFFFFILTVLAGIYGSICTWLAVSYHKLLKSLRPHS